MDRRHFIRLLPCMSLPVILPGFMRQLFTLPGVSLSGDAAGRQIHDRREPAYLALHRSGELKERGLLLHEMMARCELCPRDCHAARLNGQRGDCGAGAELEVSSSGPHFGEETELVGRRGSGTIFFTHCSLRCVFCINYDISHLGRGRREGIRQLSQRMLDLQRSGCHNINLVTPSHYLPHIMLALDRAAERGLRLPLVYNTCGWEKPEILSFLDGMVDVYLADFKYGEARAGDRYSAGAASYTEITQQALTEMHRQCGTARPDQVSGLIERGLMIRHLVMPQNSARTDLVLRWIGKNLPSDTYVNIMSQYTPVYRASEYPEISGRITRSEYNQAISWARQAGLTNIRLQAF